MIPFRKLWQDSQFASISQIASGYCASTSRKKKSPGKQPELSTARLHDLLLESGLNAGEGRVQLGPEALHNRDDGDRNASRDEAILDGSRA
jgi:hypothetical protein